MKLDEVMQWKPFFSEAGDEFDLSFLNAHQVSYDHEAPGKETITYRFMVTYSFHCFAKEYDHQTDADKQHLMYHAPKESRPFCFDRYRLARKHLRGIIDSLDSNQIKITHAGYEGYAATKIISNGQDKWYFVPFKVYRQAKKFRLHVMSAYLKDERPRGQKVSFFKIASGLQKNKLPKPHK